MTGAPYVPPATAAKLAESFPEGTRHKAAMDIAIALIGNGMSTAAVFAELRQKFPPDKTDEELQSIVRWAVDKNPTPSGFGTPRERSAVVFSPVRVIVKKSPKEHAAWWLNGSTMTQEAFCLKSQLPISPDRREALMAFLDLMYLGSDNLNLVCQFQEHEGKARPHGGGKIQTRDQWLEFVSSKGVPETRAGCWFRPNPCNPTGTGAAGAVTDSDVSDFRFLLLESDLLELSVQFSLLERLRLPLHAAYLSGGISAHALVRVDAKDAPTFDRIARRVMKALEPFGIDQCNKNPSRLSRLPSAQRVIGAANGGIQQLLWLNPNRKPLTEEMLPDFEASLLLPSIEEKPFHQVIKDSINRFDDLMANKGKLGVPTGFIKFDKISGGLKPGGYTLIAAQTGVGKTTIAMNMLNAALSAGIGVALFTLEMNREDIADMMFSMNCLVDRNKFNTGEFSNEDMKHIAAGVERMKDLPLWVEDDPDIDMDGIRKRVLALKADKRIGLVVVDYAQLVRPESVYASREQAVASVALGLRLLSRQANIPIIVLSQLNDDGRVRESRKLSHEAANVFRMIRNNLESPEIVLLVDKGRKIPSKPIQLVLKAEYCRITEAAFDAEPARQRHNND